MNAIIKSIALLGVGVAIGILVAPEKGSKTRRRINDKLDDLKDSFQKAKGVTADELDNLKDTFKHEISGLKDDVRQRVLDLIKTAKTTKNHVKEEIAS